MFFKLKEGSRTRGHKAVLVKEQCRLDMRKYSFSQRVINVNGFLVHLPSGTCCLGWQSY